MEGLGPDVRAMEESEGDEVHDSSSRRPLLLGLGKLLVLFAVESHSGVPLQALSHCKKCSKEDAKVLGGEASRYLPQTVSRLVKATPSHTNLSYPFTQRGSPGCWRTWTRWRPP